MFGLRGQEEIAKLVVKFDLGLLGRPDEPQSLEKLLRGDAERAGREVPGAIMPIRVTRFRPIF